MWPTSSEARVTAQEAADEFSERWKDIIEGGARVREFNRSRESALDIVDSMCSHSRTSSQVPLQIQKELVTNRRRLDKTDAGRLVESDIKKMLNRLEALQKQDRRRLASLVKQGDPHRANLQSKIENQRETAERWKDDRSSLRRAWRGAIRVLSLAVFVFIRPNPTGAREV